MADLSVNLGLAWWRRSANEKRLKGRKQGEDDYDPYRKGVVTIAKVRASVLSTPKRLKPRIQK